MAVTGRGATLVGHDRIQDGGNRTTPDTRLENGSPSAGALARLHEAWYSHLPNSHAHMLKGLIERYPNSLRRTELAGLAGHSPTSSTFSRNVAFLKNLGLAYYPAPDTVAATELLFPPRMSR